jgi:hypothetical protein
MSRTILAILVCSFAIAHAVNLNNWRFPYYQLATELDMVRTSPSGMFYDDMQGSAEPGSLCRSEPAPLSQPLLV